MVNTKNTVTAKLYEGYSIFHITIYKRELQISACNLSELLKADKKNPTKKQTKKV